MCLACENFSSHVGKRVKLEQHLWATCGPYVVHMWIQCDFSVGDVNTRKLYNVIDRSGYEKWKMFSLPIIEKKGQTRVAERFYAVLLYCPHAIYTCTRICSGIQAASAANSGGGA